MNEAERGKPDYEEVVAVLRALVSDVDFQSRAEKDARRLLTRIDKRAGGSKSHD